MRNLELEITDIAFAPNAALLVSVLYGADLSHAAALLLTYDAREGECVAVDAGDEPAPAEVVAALTSDEGLTSWARERLEICGADDV